MIHKQGQVFSYFLKYLLVFVTTITGLIAVASCSNVASVLNLDTDLELRVVAKADMNPDDSELASPLVVRLYELKDKKKFESLAFYDIYQNDKKLLGKNLIDKHILKQFVPDTKVKKQIVLNKKTRYVALFAEFTQYQNAEFKGVFEIYPHFDRKVDVVLTGTSLQVDNDKREKLIELETDDEFEQSVKDAKSVTDSLPGL